jgi:hypothetical protein
LRESLGEKYHIAHSIVNLSDWTDMRRPRVFIWCLHKDCGSEELVYAAARFASDIQGKRRRTQPEAVEQHLHISGTPGWYSIVVCDVFTRGKSSSQKLGKRAWEPEVLRIRETRKEAVGKREPTSGSEVARLGGDRAAASRARSSPLSPLPRQRIGSAGCRAVDLGSTGLQMGHLTKCPQQQLSCLAALCVQLLVHGCTVV